MREIRCMGDRVIVIIEEFFRDIDKKEPFEAQLMNFRLKFRAKLLEITSAYSTRPDLINTTFDHALEAIEKILRLEMQKLDADSEEYLYRSIKALEAMNEVLKEFLGKDMINNKKKLSSTSGLIADTIEKLRHEYKHRHGGFIKGLKRAFGFGRSV